MVLIYAVFKLFSAKYSRSQSKNRLTLLPLYTCLVLMLLLMVSLLMELICSDHQNFLNPAHRWKRFIEISLICVGCFTTAIQALEWNLIECMVSFQAKIVDTGVLVVRKDEFRRIEW